MIDIKSFISKMFGNRHDHSFFFEPKMTKIEKEEWTVNVCAPYEIYNTSPQIKLVADKKASMFSNGWLKLKDLDGNEITTNSEFNALVTSPNVLQSINELFFMYSLQKSIFGNVFFYAPKSSALQTLPNSLILLDPASVKVLKTGKLLKQIKFDDVVSGYTYTEGNSEVPIKTKDMLWVRNPDISNMLTGVSMLTSLKYPISNSILAYKYLNSISNKQGALGFITSLIKDQLGVQPLTPDEKDVVEKAFTDAYGIEDHQKKIKISEVPVQWTPMAFPTGQLLLQEQIDANFLTITDTFGINANCFSLKNPTYENVKNAIRLTYQDTIIPEADLLAQKLTSFFGLKDSKIEIDYAHIPFLQDDENKKGTSLAVKLANIEKALALGLLDNSTKKKVVDSLLSDLME
jgi:hypothetical protein